MLFIVYAYACTRSFSFALLCSILGFEKSILDFIYVDLCLYINKNTMRFPSGPGCLGNHGDPPHSPHGGPTRDPHSRPWPQILPSTLQLLRWGSGHGVWGCSEDWTKEPNVFKWGLEYFPVRKERKSSLFSKKVHIYGWPEQITRKYIWSAKRRHIL